jgi:phosphoglycolate phosphatase-like HAD superfamily hydrolase
MPEESMKYLFFDFDGTLYDTVEGITKCVQYALRKRGLDAELAAVCGQLHDLAAYERLSYDNHAALGAERAVQFLRELGEQDEAALCLVHSAILRHDDLGKTDGPMDEVLKDADLLDNAQLRAPEKLRPEEIKRLYRVFEELGIRQNPYGAGQATVPNSI